MNLLEELRSLDPRDPGRWPLPFRAGAVVAAFFAVTIGLIYFFVWNDQRPVLQQRQAEEQSLRTEFKNKHAKAVNLEVYKQQLKDIERSFGALLRQLPGKTEVPSLLVDISQTGLGAGLSEKLFQPQAEVKKDFYAEKPIKIRLTGSYHQFGEFVSGIAALLASSRSTTSISNPTARTPTTSCRWSSRRRPTATSMRRRSPPLRRTRRRTPSLTVRLASPPVEASSHAHFQVPPDTAPLLIGYRLPRLRPARRLLERGR